MTSQKRNQNFQKNIFFLIGSSSSCTSKIFKSFIYDEKIQLINFEDEIKREIEKDTQFSNFNNDQVKSSKKMMNYLMNYV